MQDITLPAVIIEKRVGNNKLYREIFSQKTYESISLQKILDNDDAILFELHIPDFIVIVVGGLTRDYSKLIQYKQATHIIRIDTVNNLDNDLYFKNLVKYGSRIKNPKMNNIRIFSSLPNQIIRSWKNGVIERMEDSDNNVPGYRIPQYGAIQAIGSHFSVSNKEALIVMPTGTGKTEVMITALIKLRCNKLLIIVPTDALRNQIAQKFGSLGMLYDIGVIPQHYKKPVVGVLKGKFTSVDEMQSLISSSNVVISTIKLISNFTETEKSRFADFFDTLFIDEAHHDKAKSWDDFKQKFITQKIIKFTATPFRNDKRLDGKIIYNYPLHLAQENNLFATIDFIPIQTFEDQDLRIAEKAVEILRSDIASGYDHILMARCENIKSAEKIFEDCYSSFTDLNPVVIHSQMSDANKKSVLLKLQSLQSRIVVCVDMLGEGFDLPNIKIGALHYTHKSLAITLQVIGRFTRISQRLGNAKFIANTYSDTLKEDLYDLYNQDADRNKIIGDLSGGVIDKVVELSEFAESTSSSNIDESLSIIHSLDIPLSCSYYRTSLTWSDTIINLKVREFCEKESIRFSIFNDQKLIILLSKDNKLPDFSDMDELIQTVYNIDIIRLKDGFLQSYSTQNSAFVEVLFKNEIIDAGFGENIRRVYNDVEFFKGKILGKKPINKTGTTYEQSAGRDPLPDIDELTRSKSILNNLGGDGYENGLPISLSVSKKGKVWDRKRGSILDWIKFADYRQGQALNEQLDSNLFKGFIVPKKIQKRPEKQVILIDWDWSVYDYNIKFEFNAIDYTINEIDIEYINTPYTDDIQFNLNLANSHCKIGFKLYIETIDENEYFKSEFYYIDGSLFKVFHSNTEYDIISFLNKYKLKIVFADGSWLEGNDYIVVNYDPRGFGLQNIQTLDWNVNGIDIKKESKWKDGSIRADSIQNYIIEQLKSDPEFSIVVNDDGSGEIADIVGVKVDDEQKRIKICLFHCKYSKTETPSGSIDNLYEVCGQTIKSIKRGDNEKLIKQLIDRCSKKPYRLEGYTIDDLKLIQRKINEYQSESECHIIQPGLSKDNITDGILHLLSVTSYYLSVHKFSLYVLASK